MAKKPTNSQGKQSSKSSGTRRAASGGSKSGGAGDESGIQKMYEAIGLSSSSSGSKGKSGGMLANIDVDEVMTKARNYVNEQIKNATEYAKDHPKAVLGSLAGIVIGAGALTAAAIVRDRKSAASKSKSSKASKSAASKKSSAKSPAKKSSAAKKSASTSASSSKKAAGASRKRSA